MVIEEDLIKHIERKTDLCVSSVKTGDRENAIKFRDEVIALMNVKQKEFSLSKEETETLNTLNLLAKHQNNKRLKANLLSKFKK